MKKPAVIAAIIALVALALFLSIRSTDDEAGIDVAQKDVTPPIDIPEPEVVTPSTVDFAPEPAPPDRQAEPPAVVEEDTSVATRPGVVRGMVLDEFGEIVAGAKLTLVPNPWSRIHTHQDRWARETLSDSEGWFALSGFKLGRFSLFAQYEDLVGRKLFSLAGIQAEFILTLRPGVRASGRVSDEHGRPVSGARVELAAFLANGRYVHETVGLDLTGSTHSARIEVAGAYVTTTDANGRFTLGPLPAEAFELYIEAEGFAPHYSNPHPAGATAIELELAQGGRFTGETVGAEDGLPFPNAGLVLQGETYKDEYVARSDEQGRFVINNLRPGSYRVTTTRGAPYVVAVEGGLFVEAGRMETSEVLEIPLGIGATLSGHVHDPSRNRNVQGARLEVISRPRIGVREWSALSDQSGQYTFTGLPPGTYEIVLWADPARNEYDTRLRRRVSVGLGTTLDHVDFTVQPSESIHGRVEDSNGEGVADAYVFAWVSGEKTIEATTRADGSFSLAGVKPGSELKVEAKSGRQVAESAKTVTAGEGEEIVLALIDVRIAGTFRRQWSDSALRRPTPRDNSLSGRVTDRSGRPIAGAMVRISQGGSRTAVTGVDGRYDFRGLLDKECRVLSVDKSGYLRWRSIGRRKIEPDSTTADFVLDRMGVVTGRVVDGETGESIDSFEVALASASDTQILNKHAHYNNWTRGGDPDGRFLAKSKNTRSHSAVILARSRGYRTASFEVGTLGPNLVIENVVIELDRGGQVEGRVSTSEGSPIAGAVIYAGFVEHMEIIGSNTPLTISSQDGHYQIESMPSGENSITVVHADYAILRTPLTVSEEPVTYRDLRLSRGQRPINAGYRLGAFRESNRVNTTIRR